MLLPDVVTIDKEIMSGTPVFTGTRVPVKNLIDYLEGGYDIEVFLEHFPAVKREQVIKFLEASGREYLRICSTNKTCGTSKSALLS